MAFAAKRAITKLLPRAKKIYADRAKVDELLKDAECVSRKTRLGGVYQDVKTLMSLLKDYKDGHYRSVNKSSVLMIIAGLVYLVSPIDIVPDFIFGLGFADDAMVLGYVIKKLYSVIDEYRIWKHT